MARQAAKRNEPNARPAREPSMPALLAGARAARSLLKELGGCRGAAGAAEREGLLPLVLAAAREGLVAAPDSVMERPREKRRVHRLMLAAAGESAADVSGTLSRSGVPHAVIKGASVAPLYGGISLRPMCDVDLLVAERDLPGARGALEGLGYVRGERSPVETEFAPGDKWPLGVSLDVHHRLAFPGQFAPDIDRMLERASFRDGMLTLAPEDDLLVTALDMARDCFSWVGRSAVDLAVISHTFEIDWDAVGARARDWGLAGAAWAALGCARRALGARVPKGVLRALRPSPPREAYLRAWLDTSRVSPYRLTRRTRGGAPLRLAMCVLWPVLVDGHAGRACFLARYALDRLRVFRAPAPHMV